MKKILTIAAVLMLVPFSAFALQMIDDTDLDGITAQAGVSIYIDNVQLDFSMDYLSWGDGDGINGSAAGYVNITTLRMSNVVIDAYGIGSSGIAPLNPNHIVGGAVVAMDLDLTDGTSDLHALTIDTGDYTVVDPGGNVIADTCVAIGVPTLSVYIDQIDPFDITLDNVAGNGGTALGSVALGGMQIDTKGGTVFIYAH
ncbi:hypothetical protein DSCA_19630 [Desulfosarcina alkanivorans]|jgi:hypothetical protein|uniref:DUF6160 domain-containing protein n=1 Tax=Desulfosarcina alkanivorans TaxID=571177 RepID=A0A5K7YHJ6_9BACT|nr:DUF6160 family protein [Desulfosarcina alkanivorans]BBO68033.1 hypothetical protein DSCA_19630 [Desulfosarcina alkanivorans]